jgi:hypothetical protein
MLFAVAPGALAGYGLVSRSDRPSPPPRRIPQRPHLIAAIERYLQAHNNDPKPFVWTATAESILDKVRRGRVTLEQVTSHPRTSEKSKLRRCTSSRRTLTGSLRQRPRVRLSARRNLSSTSTWPNRSASPANRRQRSGRATFPRPDQCVPGRIGDRGAYAASTGGCRAMASCPGFGPVTGRRTHGNRMPVTFPA